VRFVVEGAPRTKKNSQRIARVKGRPILLQSRQHDAWAEAAILQLRSQYPRAVRIVEVDRARGVVTQGYGPIRSPLNLRALIYRDRSVGDLGNYLAAVCDALERAGVVENDRLIGGFDGSRLLVDRERPRVEIELSPL